MTLPFENDTNSFIKKLASAQLKKERLKKIFTIVAISLATFFDGICIASGFWNYYSEPKWR